MYQVVLISPEMVQSRRFVRTILQRQDVTRRTLLFAVDEAHCVSHWGSSFRKKYGSLGIIRSFLPRAVPVLAVSATLTRRVRRDLLAKLHVAKDYIFIDVGNDRKNVSLVVRPMKHAMNTYWDLRFVIPLAYSSPEEIEKTFIYCDNIEAGGDIIDYLKTLLRPEHRDIGLIRPFNATHTHDFRTEAMDLFRESHIRIVVCTDVCGMVRDVASGLTGL